MMMILHYY